MINKLYKLGAPETGRDDLVAVLLTGVPKLNYTAPKAADLLRLNLGVPVTTSPNRLGVLGGQPGLAERQEADDDVIDIAEQAVGGFLKGTKLPLGDGVNGDDPKLSPSFPYIADPEPGSRTEGAPEAVRAPAVPSADCRARERHVRAARRTRAEPAPERPANRQRRHACPGEGSEREMRRTNPGSRSGRGRCRDSPPWQPLLVGHGAVERTVRRATGRHRRSVERSRRPITLTCTFSSARTDPTSVTFVANYIPLQDPAGGPTSTSFGDDVLYSINVDNRGDGKGDHIQYQFRFKTHRSQWQGPSSTTPGRSAR